MYKVKNLLFFCLYLIFNPKLFGLLFRKIYLPIFIQFEWLRKFKVGTVIDVGAHEGKVARVLNHLFPRATIYAFEPNEKNCEKIFSSIPAKNVRVENIALSDKKGRFSFFEYQDSSLSSLLRKSKESYRNMSLLTKKSVKTSTLDSYFRTKKLKAHIFLKIDTQGSEGLILKGGKSFLRRVSLIHIEVSFKEYYENQELFPKIYKYLTDLGFGYAGEARESHFFPIFVPEGQINAVFFNKRLIPNFYQ